MPEFYPIFLNLTGYRCLVAGFGRIGSRKLTGLLAAGCGRIDVFDSCQGDFPADRAQLLEDRRVVFYNRPCEVADVAKCLLVFAATGDKAENERIACLCRDMHVLCDSVSNPARNTFISPAVARKGALCAALSTGGQSPYLAGKWRKELEQWLEPRSELAWLMGRLRPLILKSGQDSAANAVILKKIADSPIAGWLAANDISSCRAWLLKELPFCETTDLNRILVEYEHNFR